MFHTLNPSTRYPTPSADTNSTPVHNAIVRGLPGQEKEGTTFSRLDESKFDIPTQYAACVHKFRRHELQADVFV